MGIPIGLLVAGEKGRRPCFLGQRSNILDLPRARTYTRMTYLMQPYPSSVVSLKFSFRKPRCDCCGHW